MYIKKGFAFASCCGFLGIIVLAAGVAVFVEFPKQLKLKISEKIALRNGSEAYQAWVAPPVPVYMQFWFFNITNAENITNLGAKPKVQQIGPYTYLEIRIKKNLTFSEDGTTLSYAMPKGYKFVPEKSVGSENDTFIGLNLPLLGMADGLQYKLSPGVKTAMSYALWLSGEKLFDTYSVKHYLWGYKDPFFNKVKDILITFNMEKEAAQIPDVMGLFTGSKGNMSDDGIWTVYTGRDDIKKFNQIKDWNGNSSVGVWGSSYANKINGTDGSMWHPLLTKKDRLYMFSSDVCRSVDAEYHQTVNIKGIDMFRFIVSDGVFANVTTNPTNIDFCTPDFIEGDCLPKGVLNMSACTGGPIVMSLPHFSLADESVINAIDGMHPDPVNLNTWLDIEPLTGAVLHAARRMQFNAYIKPLDALSDTQKMNGTIFPIMWLNETAMIGDDTAQMLLHMMAPLKVVKLLEYVLLVAGPLLILIGLVLLGIYCCGRNKRPLMKDDIYGKGLSVQSDESNSLTTKDDPLA